MNFHLQEQINEFIPGVFTMGYLIRNASPTRIYLVDRNYETTQDPYPLDVNCTMALFYDNLEDVFVLCEEIDEPIPPTEWIYEDEE